MTALAILAGFALGAAALQVLGWDAVLLATGLLAAFVIVDAAVEDLTGRTDRDTAERRWRAWGARR